MTTTETLDHPQTRPHALIGSDRVEGTAVRRLSGEKIGTIQRLMVDKVSGNVAYAVLRFGGFFGIGDKHLPIPWASLKYDTTTESYHVAISDADLAQAPSFGADKDFDWGDRSAERRLHDYYKARPYWGI